MFRITPLYRSPQRHLAPFFQTFWSAPVKEISRTACVSFLCRFFLNVLFALSFFFSPPILKCGVESFDWSRPSCRTRSLRLRICSGCGRYSPGPISISNGPRADLSLPSVVLFISNFLNVEMVDLLFLFLRGRHSRPLSSFRTFLAFFFLGPRYFLLYARLLLEPF